MAVRVGKYYVTFSETTLDPAQRWGARTESQVFPRLFASLWELLYKLNLEPTPQELRRLMLLAPVKEFGNHQDAWKRMLDQAYAQTFQALEQLDKPPVARTLDQHKAKEFADAFLAADRGNSDSTDYVSAKRELLRLLATEYAALVPPAAAHRVATPATCPYKHIPDRQCHVCDHGLSICLDCNRAEGELDEPCVPRR